MANIMPELVVRRPVYQQDDLHRLSQYTNPQKSYGQSISYTIGRIHPISYIQNTIPIIKWLPAYKWRHHIFGDLIAGITVAVMHIPQGMAYAILGNVPPIVGIYMAFFPVLVYFLFGTSKHNSMGTFAVTCMMTGKIVLSYSSAASTVVNNSTVKPIDPHNDLYLDGSFNYLSPIEIATGVTFMVGLMQLAMYFLRLGVISALLSETLVSGFTTAAALHVFTSQVKDLFGLQLVKRKGIFKVILTYYDILSNIDNINTVAMVISALTIIIIVFNNELLKPRLAKCCKFPIPIEMIVVVLGTAISVYMDLQNVYDITTVGHIPVGFPNLKLPPMNLLPHIMLDSFVITMVAYTISMSMALIFAQKLNYEVDSNQELMAQGLGNLVGSLFSCMPFCASLSRSLIQQSVGGQTQLASLISCSILLFVLLWIGPFFEPLPRCVLASIIVVALKGMFLQIKDFIRFLKLSHMDATIWMMTFLTVTIFDIEYGLLIGALLCLANLLTLSMKPYSCSLALLPGTELYLDTKRFKGTLEIPGLRIFHYCGGLNFASRQFFRKDVYKIAGVVSQTELRHREKSIEKDCSNTDKLKLTVFILDFSSLIHIDAAGVATVRTIVDDFKKVDIRVYITGCSGPVYEAIKKCNYVESKHSNFTIFPTVNDAVNFARHKKYLSLTTRHFQVEEDYNSRLSEADYKTETAVRKIQGIRHEKNANNSCIQPIIKFNYGTFTVNKEKA